MFGRVPSGKMRFDGVGCHWLLVSQCRSTSSYGMSRHKRVRDFDEPGHLHELTFSCSRRLPLLTGERWRWVEPSLVGIRRQADRPSLAAAGITLERELGKCL